MSLFSRPVLALLSVMVLATAAFVVVSAVPPAHADSHGDHDHGDHEDHGHESLDVSDISLHQAEVILAAAIERAEAIDTLMDIAIVDAGGNLKAFARMDGAWLGSIDISIKKAKTARFFDMPTGAIGQLSQPGGPLYGIEHSNDGLITFPGGVPILNDAGEVIGAIGVSGSTVENDHDVATAGAEAL